MWRHNIAQVASILMVEEQTLRNYLTSYQLGGIEALIKNNHKGSLCKLHKDEIKTLKLELESTINAETFQVTLIEFSTVNANSTVELLNQIDILTQLFIQFKFNQTIMGIL